jgi:hypothetical protein
MRAQKKKEKQEAAVKRKAISDDITWEKAILVEERRMGKQNTHKFNFVLYFLFLITMKIMFFLKLTSRFKN